MVSYPEKYYSLAPGLDIVPLNNGNLLFCTDTITIRIEGESSSIFLKKIVPLLDGQHSFSQIASVLSDISIDDLYNNLNSLVEANIIRSTDHPLQPKLIYDLMINPFLTILDTLGISESEAIEKLSRFKVAVFGLEGQGAYVSSILASSNISNLVLVDPYPCQPANLSLMSLVGIDSIGIPREIAIKNKLLSLGGKSSFIISAKEKITRESIAELAQGCHILVSCFDKGFSSVHHWINRASLEYKIPAIYSELKAHTAFIGPFVKPGQTSCYMCYRMRNLACEDDFHLAMSYEEFLDKYKHPMLHERGVFPSMPPYVASLLVLEILKHLFSIGQPSLADKVMEFNALSLQTYQHVVLKKPDCSVCGEKKKWYRYNPSSEELKQSKEFSGNILELADKLLSRRTGVIKEFQEIHKGISEPLKPYIFRTHVSNHRFLDKDADDHLFCSGKGMSTASAQTSALGEAIERYSGSYWNSSEITFSCRKDIESESLNPADLVLYLPDQYEKLSYAPYNENNIIGWISGKSLISGNDILVPAIAIYMNYEVRNSSEYICPVTSNGLAAGSTLINAVVSASFEIIERDAFMITWLNKLPAFRLDPFQHPDLDIVQLCEGYKRRNVDVELFNLYKDHPCSVFIALGVQSTGEGPAVVVGLGADIDPCLAARKAILEVAQVRPALKRRIRNPETRHRLDELIDNPHLVKDLEDHDLLYSSHKLLNTFDFLRDSTLVTFNWDVPSPESSSEKLQILIDHFSSEKRNFIYVNLTPPDMQALGLYTARVIISDFQPIDFGWHERRLGGRRLYEFPHYLGLRSSKSKPELLNNLPHPLS